MKGPIALRTLLFGGALAAVLSTAAQAAEISVAVNGTPLTFDQPPVQRAGRILVPLRGIFERLGASVVYDRGTITATSGSRTIALGIGSTRVLVNGAAQIIDVAPIVSGARTLVPLRFVSQALGAAVDYDATTKAVTITAVPPAPPAPPVVITPQPVAVTLRLSGQKPAPQSSVTAKRASLVAEFAQPVNPNSVRIYLDDRDLTSVAYISDTSFSYDPTFDIPAGAHTIRLTGHTRTGAAFDVNWSFTRTDAPAAHAYLTLLSPRDESTVSGLFAFYARANPNASVHLVATSWVYRNGYRIDNPPARYDARADSEGVFSIQVAIPGGVGTNINVEVTVTTPDGASSIDRLYRYHL